MEKIIIIVAVVVILALIFLRKHNDADSDYKEPEFRHSGHKWVFNGILDIDNPPADDTPFTSYEGEIQLTVKKGFMHYEMEPNTAVDLKPHLGLFWAKVVAGDSGVDVVKDGCTIGKLHGAQEQLRQMLATTQVPLEAYAFLAQRGDNVVGEVCVRKTARKS